MQLHSRPSTNTCNTCDRLELLTVRSLTGSTVSNSNETRFLAERDFSSSASIQSEVVEASEGVAAVVVKHLKLYAVYSP